MEQSYLRTERISVGYRGEALIRDISLSVRRGEILTLIGPNGAGKSTILKSLIRQLKLVAGTVVLDGKNMDTLSERELSTHLSVLMTDRIRPELMTCEDVVSTGRYPYTGRLGILSDQDKADILFGAENDVDFIACSFVSRKEDLIAVHDFLTAHNISGIDLIAKIENRAGVDHLEEICAHCDGVMVARGDLGVEIPYEELPAIQKHMITKARMLGKRVITATEMLESMINNIRPTRAEISDVANAVYDGTSAIMLSGETAAGKYPVQAVEAMSRIALETEKDIRYDKRFRTAEFKMQNVVDAISHAVCGMSIDIGAKVIVVCSLSGRTVRMVSRFRAPADILGVTTDVKGWRKLALSWGVTPALSERFDSTDVLFFNAKNQARQVFGLEKGERIVISGGLANGVSGNTNIIKAEVI